MEPSPGSGPTVLVCVVNYRTGALVRRGLAALALERELRGERFRVVVVDNDSGDDSPDLIEAAVRAGGWAPWVTVVRSRVNGGFSYGNNLAIRTAAAEGFVADFVWLLNPDACPKPGALLALLDHMATRPRDGICGGSFEFSDGRPWTVAFRFPGVLSELETGIRMRWATRLLGRHAVARTMGSTVEHVDWVAGASMLVRREVFEAVGPMDEGYFLYYEETDFCLAAHRAGWSCAYVPASRVVHDPGQSSGITDDSKRRRRLPRYWFDSRRRYFVKNHGRGYAVLVDLAWLAGFGSWRLRRWLLRKPDADPAQQWSDTLRFGALFRAGLPGNVMLDVAAQQAVLPGAPPRPA